MAIFRRNKRRAVVLQSAGSSSRVINAAPSSGLTFVDNSQGALRAVEELSKVLNESIDEIEIKGTLDELHEEYQDALDRLADTHSNCSLNWCASKEPWKCQRTESDLISIAWECAAGSYDPAYVIDLDNYAFHEVNRVKQTSGGSTKETTMILVEPSESQTESRSPFPVLVVAVRGSGSPVDYMVDLNSEPRPADAFILPGTEAHAGFLAAAALEHKITRCIAQVCSSGRVQHVLFTGHSAGAAVSSLLFSHYRAHTIPDLLDPPIHFSCITFGSPPVLRAADRQEFLCATGEGIWLNIVNEYDVVARADKPYVLALVDLLRKAYNNPLQRDTNDNAQEVTQWNSPPHDFCQYGDIVVLRISYSGDEGVLAEGQRTLSAWKVPWKEFSNLLFTRVKDHARVEYKSRVDMIADEALVLNEG